MGKHILGLLTGTKILYLLSLTAVYVLLLPLYADCQTDSLRAKIELKSSVDQSEVPFNQNLTLTVEASWEGEQDRFNITPVSPPLCENFEILGTSSLNEARKEEGKTKSLKTFKFTLKPTQTGTGNIGSVQLSYIDNLTQDSSSLSTQPISVEITPSELEKGPGYKTILILVVILILIYVIYSARRRTKRVEITGEKQAGKPAPIEESLEDENLKKLEAIMQKVQEGELVNFPAEVYKLLTGYLEEKYQIVTSGKTTNDIIGSLSSLNLSPERVTLLKEVFSACDLVKFAGEGMEREKSERIALRVREFLEQNR